MRAVCGFRGLDLTSILLARRCLGRWPRPFKLVPVILCIVPRSTYNTTQSCIGAAAVHAHVLDQRPLCAIAGARELPPTGTELTKAEEIERRRKAHKKLRRSYAARRRRRWMRLKLYLAPSHLGYNCSVKMSVYSIETSHCECVVLLKPCRSNKYLASQYTGRSACPAAIAFAHLHSVSAPPLFRRCSVMFRCPVVPSTLPCLTSTAMPGARVSEAPRGPRPLAGDCRPFFWRMRVGRHLMACMGPGALAWLRLG